MTTPAATTLPRTTTPPLTNVHMRATEGDQTGRAFTGTAVPWSDVIEVWGVREQFAPGSITPDPARHGTFRDVIHRLPAIREMGFDTLYFPPIHPIGRVNRKGPNNTLDAGPEDALRQEACDGPRALLELPDDAEGRERASDELLRTVMARASIREYAEVLPQLADIYREVA